MFVKNGGALEAVGCRRGSSQQRPDQQSIRMRSQSDWRRTKSEGQMQRKRFVGVVDERRGWVGCAAEMRHL